MTTKNYASSALLSGKIAVVHGGGGAIGGAAALAFAEEGARVFLAGRTRGRLEEVAKRIRTAGSEVDVDVVDALEPTAVEAHAERVIARAGRIDIVLNEALTRSHSRAIFSEVAARHGLTPEVMLATHAEQETGSQVD